jgi:hypothetical protein
MAPNDDRRRFSRVPFHHSAELTVDQSSGPCELLDISLRGALVAVPPSVEAPLETRCTVCVRLDPEGETTIRMDGEIAHREGDVAGIRCTEIDLESIGHLRRLLELNVGDDALMRRELTALVASRRR